jgi:hypothetical protein
MQDRGLLFIPDISGFTRFVTEMEIGHSRNIIQQLLEVLIDANQLGLEISEVEGDAILFYRFGERPDMHGLYAQIERMFCDFHRHLRTYDQRRLCQCQACTSAIQLSLKIVTHYGEFTGYNVKQFSKLIGKDVIVAHQLLKNDIAEHEYWLATDDLLQGPPPKEPAWMEWDTSAKHTETREIPFHYAQLGRLKDGLRPQPLPPLEVENAVRVLAVSREYDVDVKLLFYTAGHVEFRHHWQEGVKAIEEVAHFLPGIGTRHRWTMDDGTQRIMLTSTFAYDPEGRTVYGETDEQRTRSIHYIFEKLGDKRSRLTLELYQRKDPVKQFLFRLGERGRTQQQFERSLEKLGPLLQQTKLPVEF